MAANGLAYSRIGVSIGRAQGNAVMRNRIKRVIREAFRLNQRDMPSGYDILVTMPRRRQGRSRPGGAVSGKVTACPLSGANTALLRLVSLCHRKIMGY